MSTIERIRQQVYLQVCKQVEQGVRWRVREQRQVVEEQGGLLQVEQEVRLQVQMQGWPVYRQVRAQLQGGTV